MTSKKYATGQIHLHWATVFLMLITYLTIELRWMAERGSWQRLLMVGTHFTTGSLILLLMLSRLRRKFREKTPTIVPAPPSILQGLGHASHGMMYLIFILLPVMGLTSRYLSGHTWWLFGLSMPVAQVPNPDLAETIISWHEQVARVGYWLIGLHALAALFHHYVLRDNTLLRMLPSKLSARLTRKHEMRRIKR